jgi:transposase
MSGLWGGGWKYAHVACTEMLTLLHATKLQLTISATWRSLQSLSDFATLRSYLSTATKHSQDLLDVLIALFATGPWLPPGSIAASS